MSDTDKDRESGRGDDSAGAPEDGTDPIIGKAVGTRLKSLFSEFTSEEVPDRFLDLIGQLEEKEQADKDDKSPTSESDT